MTTYRCLSLDGTRTRIRRELTSATPDPAEFVADHPFLFVIRHRPTGTPLFAGRMADATAAQ